MEDEEKRGKGVKVGGNGSKVEEMANNSEGICFLNVAILATNLQKKTMAALSTLMLSRPSVSQMILNSSLSINIEKVVSST